MTKHPIVAIGLDTANPQLLEDLMSKGYLKNLKALREQGAYGHLTYANSSEEMQWTTFVTGCTPEQTGHWSRLTFSPDSYAVGESSAYGFSKHQPFYALGDDYRVAILKTPQAPIAEGVSGVQVSRRRSLPTDLVGELTQKYGKIREYKEYGCWWDRGNLTFLHKATQEGIARHTAMCKDLLHRESWDLFVTVIDEPHYASHDFWYLSQPDHPLHAYRSKDIFFSDPLMDVYEAADRSLGEILAEVPEDAHVLVFSIDGMGWNTTDIPSMVFLPELLYRFNFPGQYGLAKGKVGTPAPAPVANPKRQSWAGEVWQLRHDPNPIRGAIRRFLPGKYQDKLDQYLGSPQRPALTSPYQLLKQYPSLFWQPTLWYKALWPQMKAFALPSFGDGQIRINLQGREKQGIVPASEYDSLCEQLMQHLYSLKDARTGQPMVTRVIRTRQNALDADPGIPDADLLVEWQDYPTDVVDSPDFGRIGPIPYCNTGGHKPVGFLMAKGPGIEPNSELPTTSRVIDLAPTVLNLLGAPIPDYCEGKPLLDREVSNVSNSGS
jgi:predicted AlkP superfamily phosphohydrolase/phosphomutase